MNIEQSMANIKILYGPLSLGTFFGYKRILRVSIARVKREKSLA